MIYPAYEEYKESGINWIGDIPKEWGVWKLTHACKKIGSGTTPKTDNPEYYGGNILWVTTSELRERYIFETNKTLTSKTLVDLPALRLHPKGSVIIAMYGATIGRLGILGIEATTNQACCVMQPSQNLNNKYLFYWLYAVRPEIINLSSGGGQPNVSQDKISSLKISLPNFKDQQKIADFLDKETAKIDTLIEKQKRFIQLLEEKRQAVISHAVTKGLNPNVKMKDSGVEWVGDVPEHWDIKKIGYISMLKSGEGITSEKINEVGRFPVFGGNGLRGYCENFTHNGNYILIGRQGALCGNINYGAGKFWASEHAIVVYIKKNISYLWLGETLKVMNLNQYSVSAAQPGLAVSNITCLKLPYPPESEQKKIAEYVLKKNDKLNVLVNKSKISIRLLKERRTALISAAVTGKIDVRNIT